MDPSLHSHVASLLACRPYAPFPALPASLPPSHAHGGWQHPLKSFLPSAACDFLSSREAAVFLHVTPANAWRTVLDDTMRALQHSVLSLCGVQMYYGFPAGAEWPYAGADTAFAPAPTSPLSAAAAAHTEQATLSSLYEWCGAHPGAFVAYLHDKGVRRSPEDVTIFLRQWDWRRLHEYFMVEVPQGCFKALEEGFHTCGAAASAITAGSSRLHYAGNFWWARCDYINTLPHPWTYWVDFMDGFASPELWIGANAPRMFNCWQKNVDFFAQEYPRPLYVGAQCTENFPV